MRCIARFRGAESVTLDGLRQDNGWRSSVLRGLQVSVVNLLRVVAAAREAMQFVITHVLDEREQFRMFSEELLADVSSTFGLEGLQFAINTFFHALQHQSGLGACNERVPVGSPQIGRASCRERV